MAVHDRNRLPRPMYSNGLHWL